MTAEMDVNSLMQSLPRPYVTARLQAIGPEAFKKELEEALQKQQKARQELIPKENAVEPAMSIEAIEKARKLREEAKRAYFDRHNEHLATCLLEKAAGLLDISFEMEDAWDFHSMLASVGDHIATVKEVERQGEQQKLAMALTIICPDPDCKQQVLPSPYLHSIFEENRSADIAANLVTHYRHEHINYYDAAWQNSRYAKKIPGYNYDDHKELVNNRAKRQMIRALAKNKPDGWKDIIAGFAYLQHNDDDTLRLISKYVPVHQEQTVLP